jgi:hypothetical protein
LINSTKPSLCSGTLAKPIALTFPDASRISGLGLTKLWELGREKRIEIVHVGRRTLITYRSLEKLLLPELADDGPPSLPRDTTKAEPSHRRRRPRKLLRADA